MGCETLENSSTDTVKFFSFFVKHLKGAGTLLEGLKMNKTMCGVVNGSLMNNH